MFTETVDREIALKRVHPALVAARSGQVAYIARTIRGSVVATNRRLIRLDPIQRVGPWEATDITARVRARSRAVVATALGEGGLLAPQAWSDLLESVRSIDADAAANLVAFASERDLARDTPLVIREERDATLLAMELAGIERRPDFRPPHQGLHFLDGLEDVRMPERVAMDYDHHHFTDLFEASDQVGPALKFLDQHDELRLTIINVDKTRVERTTGVDLIYYQHRVNNFILVQYKRFNEKDGGWRYRPSSDASFKEELERMHTVRDRIMAATTEPRDPGEYRLNPDPFFFKFVAPTHGYPKEAGIIRGMYVPLGLWDVLERSGSLKGPRGGVVIGWEHAERWMSTTTFVEVVADAWVGTAGDASTIIAELIRTGLVLRRSIVVAIDEQPLPRIRGREQGFNASEGDGRSGETLS
jgi:hypothetical protein